MLATAPGVSKPWGYFPPLFARMSVGLAPKSISSVELNSKNPPSDRVPDVIDAALEGVLADHLGKVVLELPLALVRLLGDVGVGAERRVGECNQRRADFAVNQVVPVLEPERDCVDRGVREDRVHGEVRQLQVIHSKVAVVQVAGAIRLIVFAIVGLRRIAEVGALSTVENPVCSARVTGFKEWPGDGGGRINEVPEERLSGLQFGVRRPVFLQTLVLPLAVDSEEQEDLVLHDWSADGAPELLAGVIGMRFG